MNPEERRSYLGASDSAPALGLSRWKTQLELWAEKTGQVEPEDIGEKIHVQVGVELEDLVARMFTKETGKKVRRANEKRVDKQHPFLVAHLDRLVEGTDEVLECKTASAWKAKEWEGDDEIPQEYIIQVMHQLMVTGKKVGWIACLIGNNKFVYRRIDRDEANIADLRKNLVDFWTKFVEPKVMPAHITKNDGDILRTLFSPQDEDEEPIQMGEDMNKLIDSLQSFEDDYKSLGGQIDKTKNEIKALLETHPVAVTDKFKVSWKEQVINRLDGKALRESHPAIAQEFTRPSSTRVLRISEVKKPKAVKKEAVHHG